MEGVDSNGGGGLLVTQLSHIKELLTQLQVHLGGSHELCKHLTSEISSVTERSIGMIKSGNFGGGRKRGAGSPPSVTPSPLSGVSNMPFKTTKKRKTMEKKKKQVRVSSPEAVTPVEDGHSWRKYGQKEILGAKHPRGYYRCTHRDSQNCTATKQVQRTDGDPTLFDVIYHGEHTCCKNAAVAAVEQAPEQNASAHTLLQSLSASLTVKTEGVHAAAAAGSTGSWAAIPPFCFSSPLTPDECFFAPQSSSSPATSGSVFGQQAHGEAERRANAEYQEVVSALVAAATSAPAERAMETELDMDSLMFDTNFSSIDVSTFDDIFGLLKELVKLPAHYAG